MSEEKQPHDLGDRLVAAYNRMLERIRNMMGETPRGEGPHLQQAIDNAKERATEMGELSREEAERVGDYLRRDVDDAAKFINDSGRELGDWLRFDWQLVERSIADMFAQTVDHTRLELDRLAERADAIGEWHAGEVVGIGTLQCKGCGEVLRFHHTAHIPPCPKCHGTRYRRISHSDD